MRSSILLTAVLAFLSAGALADSAGTLTGEGSVGTKGIEPKTFDEYDKNGDGVLEEEEVMTKNEGYIFPGDTDFNHVDSNNDDQITREEWSEHFDQ